MIVTSRPSSATISCPQPQNIRGHLKTYALLGVLLFFAICATACSDNSSETANKQAGATPKAVVSPAETSVKPLPTVPPNTGSIDVKSTPPGAAIMLISREEDSVGAPESKGITPALVTGITPGKYTVDVEMNGYKYYQKDIEVKVGTTVKVDARLKKK